VSLRYDPVYDQIKEARRFEDELSQGIWEREVKQADYDEVIRLAGDALATRSKDLQLAAWLVEALLYAEGISGLRQGLELTKGLLETYWDTVHPELEDDGDAFMRSGILDWIGSYLEDAVKSSPLTRGGLSWYQYKESRVVGSEADCNEETEKLQARSEAIEEGKIPAEGFDAELAATPKAYYEELKKETDDTLELIRSLEAYTDEKFTEEPPSFSGLRSSLEEFDQTLRVLLATKREQEPDADTPGPAMEERAAGYAEPAMEAAAPPAPASASIPGEPSGRDDAVQRVVAAAAFLRKEDAYNPVPYLVLRALRWGELRAGGPDPDPRILEPPPSEIRQELKSQAMDGQWESVLDTAERAMGLPCGRGWLDLQRYVIRACMELGSWYDAISKSVLSELQALLTDYPGLPEMTLMDDTATANRETRAWLGEALAPPAPAAPAPGG